MKNQHHYLKVLLNFVSCNMPAFAMAMTAYPRSVLGTGLRLRHAKHPEQMLNTKTCTS